MLLLIMTWFIGIWMSAVAYAEPSIAEALGVPHSQARLMFYASIVAGPAVSLVWLVYIISTLYRSDDGKGK